MHNLVKEAMRIYSQFQVKGPAYLNTLDTRQIVEGTMRAIKIKPLMERIRKDFSPQGEISMLPIHSEPDNKFSITLFATQGGFKIPFHDHPDMFVFTHVMSGNGERESWDLVEQESNRIARSTGKSKILQAIKHPVIQLNEGDNCFTTPNMNNVHRFSNKSDSDIFVFIDVVLPNYSSDRVISYYEPQGETSLQLISNAKLYPRHPINIDINDYLIL